MEEGPRESRGPSVLLDASVGSGGVWRVATGWAVGEGQEAAQGADAVEPCGSRGAGSDLFELVHGFLCLLQGREEVCVFQGGRGVVVGHGLVRVAVEALCGGRPSGGGRRFVAVGIGWPIPLVHHVAHDNKDM